MIMKIKALALSFCAVALGMHASVALSADAATTEPLQPIAALDVPRYMGTWYEIARYPNWFQKKCVGDTRADYSLQPNGRVQVINRCREASGELSEAVGMARQIGAADSPKLEVRFAPAWLSFLPMVWGDYWVIDLDPDYRLVAVSEPSREYLWVLSRTPAVDAQAYEALLARLAARGFDPGKLERTTQPGN
jgi:apolipoprotein D and lipocalin family protein